MAELARIFADEFALVHLVLISKRLAFGHFILKWKKSQIFIFVVVKT